MYTHNLSRRGFLARCLATLTAGGGLPLWYARDILADAQQQHSAGRRAVAANDRLTLGIIGTGYGPVTSANGAGPPQGRRGVVLLEQALAERGVQVTAVCDVDRGHRDFAASLVGPRCLRFTDYRDLLARRDIDAVVIATPDHWHALIALAAMRAGKDVYCEKPLTFAIDEGKALVRVARATGRVLQTGAQQRSMASFRLACELVRNGRLGRVRTIETRIPDNPRGGPFPARDVPEGLDWSYWLGPAPQVDYVRERCHETFRYWYEYSGGRLADWGAHNNDIAQWALGTDDSGPVHIEGRGTVPPHAPNAYNVPTAFTVTYTYSDGTVVRCIAGRDHGIRFEGENGRWVYVNRRRIDANARQLLDEPLPASATRLVASSSQLGNFLECVRSRRQPICHVGIGHRSATVCHLGNIALRTGQRLRWDPRDESFVGAHSEVANGFLSRTMRAPWADEWRRLTQNA
jgi:predicted dehydrogenase